MRFLKEIRIPAMAEQTENEDKPFVAVWYGENGNVEERISRAEAIELEQLAREGKI